jgi:sulfoxide reductase heme-binding subunit YedZ
MNKFLASKWTKVGLFLLCLVPLSVLVWFGFQQDLTANPLEYITHYTGDWTIRFIMITLSVTPLRIISNRPALTRFRRMLGLYAFFYGSLHLLTWVWFDRQFEISGMWEDIAKRPYITLGMAGFLAMLPLAITSTAGWVRRLGYQKWQKLHRLVYFTGAAGCIHYQWLVKSDIRKPLMYWGILVVLLGFRAFVTFKKRSKAARPVMVRSQA